MDPVICTISQISTAKYNAKTRKMTIEGLEVGEALVYGKVISIRENLQMILDHNGYKCKITVWPRVSKMSWRNFQNHSELVLGRITPKVGDFYMVVILVNKIQGKMVTAQATKIMKCNLSPEGFDQFCKKGQEKIRLFKK